MKVASACGAHALRAMVAAAAAAVLFGCAAPGSIAPNTTLSDVRARVGYPTDIRFDANGDELWEYARGPEGTETYLVRAGKDGRVKGVTQLLTPERLIQGVEVGKTTKAQVRDLLGRPSDLRYLRSGLMWEWRAALGPELGHLAVRFDDNGVVAEKMVLTDPKTDDGRGSGGK